jgi:hypothetical protein
MKASVRTGSFDFFNKTLVPTSGISGTANCEAGAGFRYKNTWTMSSVMASTRQSLFSVNAVLWKTPSQPYVLSYVALRYTTNLTAARTSGGTNFSTLAMALEINDDAGNHSLVLGPSVPFVGTTSASYIISGNRSLYTSVVDPGFVLNAYNTSTGDQEGAVGGAAAASFPMFHAYDDDWYAKDLWIAFTSEPSGWSLSGTVELDICGYIFG